MLPRRPPLEVIEGRAGPESRSSPLELVALGTGLVFVVTLLARLPTWRGEIGTFQALCAAAFLFYALAVGRARRFEGVRHAGWSVFLVAAAARVALLPVAPSLSDDIYRYVWEGKVAVAGGDPYRASPLAPELAPLRDPAIFPRINHPELATIYPPLSIAGFALVAKISPSVTAMKLWVTLHDLALVVLLLAWARRRGESAVRVIAYAWNPLVLVEYAGSGHNDPASMVWLVAALMWAESRPTAAAAALGVGALTKLAPLAALPFLMRTWPWRARLLAGSILALGLGWFGLQTRGPDSGLLAYGSRWRNNDLLFHYLEAWGGSQGARVAAAALVALVVVLLFLGRRGTDRATRDTLRAGLLLSPVAHPWYFGWAMLFEPLRPSGPWLLLSLTCLLSYGVFSSPAAGSDFHLSLGWRWVEYGLPLALAVGLGLASRRHTRH